MATACSFLVILTTMMLIANVSVSNSYSVNDLIEETEYRNIFLEEWETFKAVHGKTYENDVEEAFRQKIYLENRHRIAEHNKGDSSFTMEINRFGDLLFHEFSSMYNTFTIDSEMMEQLSSQSATFISPAHVAISANQTVDWRDEGAVTPVKDQQRCGSCWSFGTTGALEGQHFRKTNKLVSLSEQNLVDCVPSIISRLSGAILFRGDKYGCNGCEGGNFFGAFMYIRDAGGIDTEDSYPYRGTEQLCKYNPDTKGATAVGYVQIPKGDEHSLLKAVTIIGPVVVAIDVEQSFQMYSGGIYYESSCNSDERHLNHAVLVVGYGTDDGQDYWLVKNSWGPKWGQDGYIKMARNRDNNCGIATYAGYPIV